MGDRPTGAGRLEHQRVAILAQVDVRGGSGPLLTVRVSPAGAGLQAAKLSRTGQGRLAAVRAAQTSRVSWSVSSTLAGLSRELSRPRQQAITWSITAP